MGVEICFDGYLRSVMSAYQQWWRLYTLTDATGRESHRVESDRIAPAFFDFGLMVQTVEPPKAEQEGESERDREKKEKIERLPVLEGICKYAADHVLLVGRPGSGKSTALARLLLQEVEKALEDKQAKIPVLVELRYLPSEANESSVCDRILAFIHKHDPALDIDEAGIKQLLRQGRLLLLVDGVNELPSDRGRVMLNQFRELYQKTCPMIFTTRELSVGGDLGIAKRLEMQPLTEPQMQQFVMAYLPTQGERLLQQLSGRLREFGQTPLLLWMLCELFQQSEQIPENLGKVFQVFTQTYENSSVRNHEVAAFKNNVQPLSDRRIWKDVLKRLASKMMQGNSPIDFSTVISKDETMQELKVLFKDELQPPKLARDCLDDLLNYHLIQICNEDEDKVEFRHQLIQEYYAAEWLLGLLPSLSDARLRHDYLNYLKWTEPLALMLELVESEEQAVRVVRLALEVDLRLGARLAGAVKYGFQEKTVGLLIREIEEWKTPKLYAINLLGETKSGSSINSLITALDDTDGYVRRNAVEALGKIGNDKAVDALISALKNAGHDVRRNAVEVLGKIGNDKAVDALISALKNADIYVGWRVVEALGKIGNDKAVDPLIFALNDPDDYVRRNAVEALGKIGNDKAVDALISALNDTDINVRLKYINKYIDYDVCGNVVEALGRDVRKNLVEALGKIGNDKAVDALISALNHEDIFVRGDAVEALGKIDNDKAVDALISALNHKDIFVRGRVAEALGKISNDKAVDALISSLNDAGHDVRENVVAALGKIGNDKAVDSLISALKNADIYVRRNVIDYDVRKNLVEALVKIDNDKAVDALISALNDTDIYVRWRVAEALVKIDNDKAVDPLISALNHKDIYVRWRVAEALGKIGNDKAVDPLITTLNDADDDVRRNVAWALGKIGNDKAVDPLISALNDVDDDVRRNVAWALGKIGNNKAVDPLISALNDTNIYVRWRVAEALGKIGNDKAVDPLITTLNDVDDDVRRNVAWTLGKIGNDKAVDPLISALNHTDIYVRRNAVEALGKIDISKVVNTVTFALLNVLKSNDVSSIKKAIEILCKIGGDILIRGLIPLLQDDNDIVRHFAAKALSEIISPTLIDYLYNLIPTTYGLNEIRVVIAAIQARCKYYNYDIAQTPLSPEDNPKPTTTGNTYIFNDKVDQVIAGNQIIQGDNIATQNNQKTARES